MGGAMVRCCGAGGARLSASGCWQRYKTPGAPGGIAPLAGPVALVDRGERNFPGWSQRRRLRRAVRDRAARDAPARLTFLRACGAFERRADAVRGALPLRDLPAGALPRRFLALPVLLPGLLPPLLPRLRAAGCAAACSACSSRRVTSSTPPSALMTRNRPRAR